MTETHRLQPYRRLTPAHVRYIKLGAGNAWARQAIEQGRLVLHDPQIPHGLCETGEWDQVKAIYAEGRSESDGTAARLTGEMKSFYTLGPDCLWVTFVGDLVYWGFAEPAVQFDAEAVPCRWRQMMGGWRYDDLNGQPLGRMQMSSKLTMTGASQATICELKGKDYLLRRIHGDPNPLEVAALAAEDALVEVVLRLMADLHQDDLEVIAVRIAHQYGWKLDSPVGGRQPHIDFIGRNATDDIRLAYFQTKMRAGQAELDAFDAAITDPQARKIFVVLSPTVMDPRDRPNLEVWTGHELGQRTIRAGLLPWILRRTR